MSDTDFGAVSYVNDEGTVRFQPRAFDTVQVWMGGGGDLWKTWTTSVNIKSPALYKSRRRAVSIALKEYKRRRRANWRRIDE